MASEAYLKLLRDPRWQRLRLEVMKRDDFTCTSCGDNDRTLHIHHKRYVRGGKPWDSPAEDLTTLCESCHETITAALPIAKEALIHLDSRTLTRLCGMMVGLAFRQRQTHILRSVEFADYEMIDAFARDVGLMADNVALLVQDGRIDLKALAAREDEILARLEAADLAEMSKAERKE